MLDLSALNPEQKDAVLHGGGPLLILAGAGSGKTRVITTRVAHLIERGVKPWNILAVTFTNKAAREMRERIFALAGERGAGAWVSTFHSLAAQFLRVEGPARGLDRNFTIYDEDDQKRVVKECLAELNLDDKKIKPGAIVSRISREKDQLMDPESFSISALASPDPSKQMLASIYTLYQKKLEKAMAADFGDLIMKTVEFLQGDSLLKEKYQERFQHVLVDEYQDTNRAQYVLSKTLAAKHKNICVVGDDDQSIYSWRGADIRNILDFEKDYASVKVVKLERNYRSTQAILECAWKLVQNNRMRKEKRLWTERSSQERAAVEQLGNELEEAAWIAGRILSMRREGLDWRDFAVFYRTNAQSRVLEDALRGASIPYVLVGNVRFYERAEVKDVLAYLKLVSNPKDDLSLKRVLNFPPRGIGKATLEVIERAAARKDLTLFEVLGDAELLDGLAPRVRENVAQFRRMLLAWIGMREQTTVSALAAKVLAETKILELFEEEAKSDVEAAGRLDNIQELLNATEEFEEMSDAKTVGAYLEQVSLLTDLDLKDDKEKSRVTLMTVHIAKGLEFPAVFLTGLEEGLFPLGEAQFSEEDLEEERRIAYVGMTRAKDHLFLTSAASRKLFGQTRWNLPSRFIQEAGLSAGGEGRARAADFPFPAAAAPRARGGQRFRVGERVRHPDFGTGHVTQRSGDGDDLKVVVMFDSGQWKKLLVKYAPLEKA